MLKVKLKKEVDDSYEIVMGCGLNIKKLVPKANRYVVITDNNVKKLYGEKVAKNLKADLLSFPAGEKNKNRETKARLEDEMIKLGCGRDTLIIALGGGVVGDLAGFIAATYMRGIPYIQIPTTLLAMVDSSVGGKTAVDTAEGKNLIGVFCQPNKVLVDINYLDTLPKKQLINGLFEAIKMFLTHDKQMFNYTEKNLNKIINKDKEVLQKIIKQAVKIKAEVVQRDEKENNERMVLNFGHTIGHVIEKLSDYKLLHGYAVGLGILVEARMAELLNILSANNYESIKRLFKQLGIDDRKITGKIENIIKVMNVDKKNNNGKSKFVLLKNIGEVSVANGSYAREVDLKIIKSALIS